MADAKRNEVNVEGGDVAVDVEAQDDRDDDMLECSGRGWDRDGCSVGLREVIWGSADAAGAAA